MSGSVSKGLRHGTYSGYRTYKCRCGRCAEAYMASNTRRYEEFKEWIGELKDKPCADCGGRFPTACMEFDHRDPASKAFNISTSALRRRVALETEVAKCDVVCSNCHRVRTAQQRSDGTIKVGRPRKVV